MIDDPGDFLERATDPAQYDSPELRWEHEGFVDSSVRMFFWDKLKPVLGNLQGKSVLDIGTGTAWLPFRMLGELDADSVTALEPSQTQRGLAHKFNPAQKIEPVSLLDYETDRSFDVVTAIMVFEHIQTLDEHFEKLSKLANPGSQLVIIMADKDTFLRSRPDYQVEQQQVDEETFVVRAMRTYGLLHDIVRPVETLVAAAEQRGFRLQQHQALAPDDTLRKEVSRYNNWQDQPICHLLSFEQTG